MNQPLRDRIMRQLESLSDERLYQVLDYVEFLESKYGIRQPPTTNVFQRFADTVEDRLRAGRVSATTIAETMALMNKAMGVLNGVAAAGRSVANDLVGAATRPPQGAPPPSPGGSPGGASSAGPTSAGSPAATLDAGGNGAGAAAAVQPTPPTPPSAPPSPSPVTPPPAGETAP